ncbi:hypothetical protein HN51_010112 [Arachis hypogaea]|uniref:protein TOC75, chloroplastic isoform X1 n=1 Tax=Arachis hypogaea TaxID=3818 RepID=UPI000DEC4330|nr:protein TOC75, chloroplastic isoform X1 [Arachis hypogaea]
MNSSFAANHLITTPTLPPPCRTSSYLKCQLPSSSSSDHTKDHSNSTLIKTLSTTFALSSAASIVVFSTSPLRSLLPDASGHFSSGSGGNAGNGGNTGGGGGGGGGGWFGDDGSFWSRLFCLSPAIAADESPSPEWDSHGLPANIVVQLNKLSGFKKYKISDISFFDRSRRVRINAPDDSFFELVSLRPAGVYTKSQLQKEVKTLASCGMFEKVDMEGKTNPDGTISLTIAFTESTWQSAEKFRCINVGLMAQSKPIEMDPDMTDKERLEYHRFRERNYKRRMERARPCLLPMSVHREIADMLRSQGAVSARLLQRIRDHVQKWYHDEGYACAQVVNFGNLNTQEVVCEVVEGDITQLTIMFLDKLGNVVEGNTQIPVVQRELPRQLRPGYVFNIEAAKQALRNINSSLALFSKIEVNPKPDEKSEGGIIVEIKLKELDQKTAEVSTEWSIVPGRGGRPTLASLQPGGTVTFEHRNLQGLNRSVSGSVTTSNFFNPQDDLAFKLEYAHPYLDGVYDPRNRTLRVSCFNSRKQSPVFTGGPEVDEVPPIWVDRAGLKANITENFTRQSKFTYGLVMEEITTRDKSSHICASGQRVLPSGGIADGPPTTLSGTGIDRMAFLQANITRDNTKFVNGAIVGERNVFQVDQGLGIGSNFPFFNRHQLTITRFIQLMQVEKAAGKPPPPVVVLHGHYAGCVGDLPSYDAFPLGGPYSVRGYNMGELGAARNILELAAELRVPVKGTHAYAFVEHGNDLGSSKDVKGNPTEVYRRMGHGSSYGVGLKLGLVRAEYAVDHNSGTGAVFFRFGERF